MITKEQIARETECRVRKLAREILVASVANEGETLMGGTKVTAAAPARAFALAEEFEAYSEARWEKLK